MSKGKTTSSTTVDPQQMAIFKDLYDEGKSMYNTPFQPFTGQGVAGFTPDQLEAQGQYKNMLDQSLRFGPRDRLNNLASAPTPQANPFAGRHSLGTANTGTATDIDRNMIRDVTPRSLLDVDMGAYQNPFTEQVIDNTLGDLNDARQMQIQKDQDAAIGRGAFGGSRSAILESETNKNFFDKAGDISSQLRKQSFDSGANLAGQDIGRDFQAQNLMSDYDKQVAMANAGYGNQFGMANLDAQNRFGMANMDAQNQFGLANMDALNRAAMLNPQLEMQNRQFQAGLFGNQLADQYKALGLFNQVGNQQQGLNQAQNQFDYNEFLRGYDDPFKRFSLLTGAASGMPVSTSTTSQKKTGLGDVLGTAATLAGSYFMSDKRMKKDITFVGKEKGHNIYTWNWKDEAKEMGWDKFPTIGVIAQEVKKYMPEAVVEDSKGYYRVNYGAL